MKKKLGSCSHPDPSPEKKDNKEGDTRPVKPYLTRALCLRLGDRSTIPVHDRFRRGSRTSIVVDIFDGSGTDERPLR